jgi:hypothetical protein
MHSVMMLTSASSRARVHKAILWQTVCRAHLEALCDDARMLAVAARQICVQRVQEPRRKLDGVRLRVAGEALLAAVDNGLQHIYFFV